MSLNQFYFILADSTTYCVVSLQYNKPGYIRKRISIKREFIWLKNICWAFAFAHNPSNLKCRIIAPFSENFSGNCNAWRKWKENRYCNCQVHFSKKFETLLLFIILSLGCIQRDFEGSWSWKQREPYRKEIQKYLLQFWLDLFKGW